MHILIEILRDLLKSFANSTLPAVLDFTPRHNIIFAV